MLGRYIELSIFMFFWVADVIIIHSNEPLTYFVWKFSTLTWITINLTIVYLFCCIKQTNESSRNTLFVFIYSLNFVVVSAYWLLFSIDPKLIDRNDYKSFDLDYISNLFIHGGNLFILTIHFVSLDDFKGVSIGSIFKLILITAVGFPLILFTSKKITGISVYNFLDALSLDKVVLFFVAFDIIGFLVGVFFLKFFANKEKIN